ncbi:hypothetical protein SERLADRAFT_468680 [Serpula lacrymans var. lacrymans S7.9]|uniref:Uncharacterized protein n=1 Tax=Serpula lacrymans var. lacrymans (strain S7.9) TaxID=578457 RepID=F8NY56_SERL9|nr:uncharacterized protein SERLADRAFT_468680 [Serpula lacrymans var. lacrymans S7.9]EGO24818.1 hypothetical protein SERLADRAFT_468680 [Serpula lacrymans var. lacrymans S7.9]
MLTSLGESLALRQLSAEHVKETDDYRKLSLNILVAFLALHSISGSHVLSGLTLALVLYTVSLHMACRNLTGACEQLDPHIFSFLNAIPGLGISVITCIELFRVMSSPTAAVFVILACFVPPLTLVAHRFCAGARQNNAGPRSLTTDMEVGMRSSTCSDRMSVNIPKQKPSGS